MSCVMCANIQFTGDDVTVMLILNHDLGLKIFSRCENGVPIFSA